jgi:hypothetical protein
MKFLLLQLNSHESYNLLHEQQQTHILHNVETKVSNFKS